MPSKDTHPYGAGVVRRIVFCTKMCGKLCFAMCFPSPFARDALTKAINAHIAAASLIHRLAEEGIRVPQDIQVACFGSSEISRLYRPSITAVTLDNMELGRQAVSIFAYLRKADPSVSISVRVAGKLVLRESTLPEGIDPILSSSPPAEGDASSFYDDDEVLRFTQLEKLLTACDKFDHAILGGYLAGKTSEQLSEHLNMAPETIRYRMRRLAQQIGCDSRTDLLDFLRDGCFLRIFGMDVKK